MVSFFFHYVLTPPMSDITECVCVCVRFFLPFHPAEHFELQNMIMMMTLNFDLMARHFVNRLPIGVYVLCLAA